MNSATAIIDARAPRIAIAHLRTYCDVFMFESAGITYDAICGHPDVFLFQSSQELIIAPNTPRELIDYLRSNRKAFRFGSRSVGHTLRESTLYNSIATKTHLFHKSGYSDASITRNNLEFVHVPQAYTRCSSIAIDNNSFITSDRGMEKALLRNSFNCLFCDPSSIILPPYSHGFIGGCMGMHQDKLFVIGALRHIKEASLFLNYVKQRGLSVVELYDGPLFDGGGIFFI